MAIIALDTKTFDLYLQLQSQECCRRSTGAETTSHGGILCQYNIKLYVITAKDEKNELHHR